MEIWDAVYLNKKIKMGYEKYLQIQTSKEKLKMRQWVTLIVNTNRRIKGCHVIHCSYASHVHFIEISSCRVQEYK